MNRLLLFTAFILAACAPITPAPQTDGTAAGVFFTAERVGPDVVRLALDNGAPEAIGYNLCASELQRRINSTWTRVETEDVCTMQLLSLNPGADATFEKKLSQLPPGEYRYVTKIESPFGTPAVTIATAPFTR